MADSKGKIAEAFQKQVDHLVESAAQQAIETRKGGKRPWQAPDDWEGSPLNLGSITGLYDRTEIGQVRAEIMSDDASPGTCGDAMSLVVQGDFLASAERAFRARHATPVRCLAHATVARRGHGHAKGVIANVRKYATDLIAAGAK